MFFQVTLNPSLIKRKSPKRASMSSGHAVKYSEWAPPIIPVVKFDGTIYLCGNYKVMINPVLIPDTYPFSQVDYLFGALSGGKVFSKLDLSYAYLQVPLDDIFKKLTTINTLRGLFQYEPLPSGISSAPSLFQRIMETLLIDINHVCVYLDDILVVGTNKEDHLQNLYQVFKCLKSARLTLKKSKYKFFVSSVEYLSHVIDRNGLHPSESKVRAVKEVPHPSSVTDLSSDHSTFITSSY